MTWAPFFCATRPTTGWQVLFGVVVACSVTPATSEFTVSLYIPEYRMGGFNFNKIMRDGTHAIMFSLEPTRAGRISEGRHVPAEHLARATAARDKNGGKVFVSVGGAGRSDAFPYVTSSAKLRQQLVGDLILFCKKHRLDGVDWDWEGPGNPEQVKQYGMLLSNTRKMFREHGLMVTVAIHVWQDLGALAFNNVDRVHLMAYDAQDAQGHSTFDTAVAYVKHVASFAGKGKTDPKLLSKLMLGIPAYGRNRKNPGEVQTYEEIYRDHSPGPSIDELPNGMYFNGVDTVMKKARWARSNGLAGVMVWEAGQDTKVAESSLVHALQRVQDEEAAIQREL